MAVSTVIYTTYLKVYRRVILVGGVTGIACKNLY